MSLTAKRPGGRTKEDLLKAVRDEDEPKKRMNIIVEASLYRRIKARAASEDRTISEITLQLWHEYMSK